MLILLGVVLRVALYAANRSFWLDEAMLVRNIVDRSLTGLARPLDYGQGAPLGFLYVEKALESLVNRDYILRLFPLVAGCVSLYLIYRLARHCVAAPFALVALALFGVSGPLIYYSSELKQYSSDVLVALLLLLAAAPFLEGRATRRDVVLLALGGTVGLWFSHPALFVLAGIWLTLALQYALSRDWGRLRQLTLLGAGWAVSLGLLYLVSLRHLAANEKLLDYWRAAFMPMPPWRDPSWAGTAIREAFSNPTGLSLSLLGVLLAAGGLIVLVRRRWQWGLVLVLPLVMTLVASGFRKYPFGGRMLLFAVPILLIAVSAGIEGVYEAVRLVVRRRAYPAMALCLGLAVVLLYGPTAAAVDTLVAPPMGEHLKPALAYLETHRQPGDTIYVYYSAYPAFKYYAPMYALDDPGVILGSSSRADPEGYLQDVAALAGKGRVWLLFSHVYSGSAGNEKTFMLEHLDRIGTKEEQLLLPGASLYRYRLDG